MRANTTRSILWAIAALASMSLAIGIHEAAKAADPARALATTIVAQLVLAVAGALVFATRSREPAAHTRARWSALESLRVVVTIGVFGFLAGIFIATLFGVPLANVWVQLALVIPAGCAALCVVGAILDQERIVRAERATTAPAHDAASARKVYETRTGAVLVEERDGQRDIILTGPDGKRDVNAVAREIDERGWREGEEPAPAELTSALQRWGVLRGNSE